MGTDKVQMGYFQTVEGVQYYTVEGATSCGEFEFTHTKYYALNMGERVWTVNAEDVANLGRFISTGTFSPQRTIAVSGNAVDNPVYFKRL